jgi:hypothetical protein
MRVHAFAALMRLVLGLSLVPKVLEDLRLGQAAQSAIAALPALRAPEKHRLILHGPEARNEPHMCHRITGTGQLHASL